MFPLLCLGSCVNICQIQFQSMDLSTKLHETSLVFCPTLSDPNFVQLPQWKSSCKLQNTLQWFFFAGPHLWIPPLFTNKNTFVSAKATQLQHIRGLVWSSAYRILRNINSMASDLMVLPRCYTTLMATCSARNGGWTGHGFWSDPWTHCTQQLQHWMACKDETIWRETTTVQDLWWMAVIFCFITSFIKAFHLSPVFFFFRGIGKGYTGGYHEYFGPDADIDSHIYLMLANDLIHSVVPLVHFGVILPVMSKEWCLKEWGTWMKLKLHLVWYKKWHLE